MRFLKFFAIGCLFLASVTAHAADAGSRSRPGTISGALSGATGGAVVRMPSMPSLPNVSTGNANMTAPKLSGYVGTGVDYCRSPNFNRELCCARPNPPATVDCGIGGNIDYCVAPNIDVDKCCIQNPLHEMCDVTPPPPPVDPCVAPNIDIDKCCAENPTHAMCEPEPPVEPDECDINIPLLGTDICTARRACMGIIADGFGGIFDEETLACNIPVVAHNWGGVIKKDGQPVMTYVPMGSLMRCDQKLFEQVSNLRRSSQWVVPTMVVGGAGLGTGIGAIIDANQNRRAEELAMTDYDYCVKQKGASHQDCEKLISTSGSSSGGATITYGAVTYNLPLSPTDAAALRAAIERDVRQGGNLNSKISQARDVVENCVRAEFHNLVSVNVSGSPKWGRIKIASNNTACDTASDSGVLYCQFQNIHGTTAGMADCAKNSFADSGFTNTYLTSVDSRSPSAEKLFTSGNAASVGQGKCYFRDSLGAGETRADATVQMDENRTWILRDYIENGPDGELKRQLSQFEYHAYEYKSGLSAAGDILGYVTVESKGNAKFSDVARGSCGDADLEKLLPGTDVLGTSGNASIGYDDNLMEAYGALLALQDANALSGGTVDLNAIMAMIDSIENSATAIYNMKQGVNGEAIVAGLGAGRKFMQTATGRGLLIGTGVGSAAGLGYWFAEGASVFCNVGGLDQVKLNRSYSIQSFRDYIISRNYIK
ncbi:MAG: hypothetical protein LBR41_02130 [Rickettsiales bacterium]|jgi:hypothetical protein|nr:hypothetical protein [Rickettsiales bacterium]